MAATGSLVAEFKQPVLGHIPGESSQALLRIDGIPGAAQVRPLADAGELLEWRYVSAEQNYALAIRSTDRAVAIVRLDRDQSELTLLQGIPDPHKISLSQSGTVAAIYSQEAGSIQVVSGLPHYPVFQRAISTAALENKIGSLAVSDDGTIVLVSSTTQPSELLVFSDNGLEIATLPSPIVSIVFRPKKHEAAILTTHQMFLATDLSQRTLLHVSGPEQGLTEAAAVEFSRDGRRIYIADPGARSVHILDLGLTSATTIPCDCSPLGLQRLRGESVFWLNEPGATVTRLLDGDSTTPRVLLAPHTAVSN